MARNFYLLLSDYLLFIIVVAATTVIPLWSRFFGKKKTRTKADYVFATGAVSAVSMMLSIARGTLGVRSFLGENFSFVHLVKLVTKNLKLNVKKCCTCQSN